MFDIGFIELCLLGIVALLVVGPKRLPKVAYEAGLWFGRIQRYLRNMRLDVERELHNYEIQQALDQQTEELDAARKLAEDAKQEIDQSIEQIMQPTKNTSVKSANNKTDD